MRGGAWSIGVPLTVLQCVIHGPHVPLHHPELVAANFAMGYAVYGADRARDGGCEPPGATRASAALGAAYLAAGAHTAPLGAVCAQRTNHSIVARGTGRSLKSRTLRRRRSASWKVASACSGGTGGS